MVMATAKSVIKVDLAQLYRLGIDEISLVKRQGKFIVVLVDL
jgi:transposase